MKLLLLLLLVGCASPNTFEASKTVSDVSTGTMIFGSFCWVCKISGFSRSNLQRFSST